MTQTSRRTPRLPPEVRRKELLDAALGVITDAGFDAFNVETVARRAGVSRPVIYDYFGDLDGLLSALIDREERRVLEPMLEIVAARPGPGVDPEDHFHESLLAFLRAVHAEPRSWQLVLMPPEGRTLELRRRIATSRRVLAGHVVALLEWGIEARGGPKGLDLPLCSRVMIATAEDAARLSLLHPDRFPPEVLASTARATLALLPADTRPRGEPPPASFDAVRRSSRSQPAPAEHRRMSRAERRQQLLDAALELIAESGFEDLSIESIARRAGINRAVVYRNFANLKLLLIALMQREDKRTRAMLASLLPEDVAGRTAPELLADTFAAFLDAVLAAPRTYRVVLLRPESAPFVLQKMVNRRRANLAERLAPLVRWGVDALGVNAARIDVELVCRLLLSLGEELARLALDDDEFPPERILSGAWSLLDQLPLRS